MFYTFINGSNMAHVLSNTRVPEPPLTPGHPGYEFSREINQHLFSSGEINPALNSYAVNTLSLFDHSTLLVCGARFH